MQAKFESLPLGEFRAVKADSLCAAWGLRSAREVRRAVHEMRKTGLIICSGQAGYWRPETMDEIQRTVKRLHGQAKATFVAAQGAAKVLKDAGGAS
ncbi:MAG: hypothetical protein ACOX6Y_07800 [Christensenellales bacterium]|jgi:hypothetical protein